MDEPRLLKLSEFLTPVSRPEAVDPEAVYRLLGAKWYAGGLYVKAQTKGADIRAPKVYRVKAGDFVYNRLFAWKGSFAIVPDETDDCHVSNEFPSFLIDRTQVLPDYLWRYFSRPRVWDEVAQLSSGGTPTSRNRLKESKLLLMEMLVPCLQQQTRVLEVFCKIDRAMTLHEEIAAELKAVNTFALESIFP